jgi:hypothetical protein
MSETGASTLHCDYTVGEDVHVWRSGAGWTPDTGKVAERKNTQNGRKLLGIRLPGRESLLWVSARFVRRSTERATS